MPDSNPNNFSDSLLQELLSLVQELNTNVDKFSVELGEIKKSVDGINKRIDGLIESGFVDGNVSEHKKWHQMNWFKKLFN